MNLSQLADQVRDTPLRNVLAHYGFDVKPEGTTLRAKTERHNIVVTGSRWFDNKAGVGGGGAIDLVMHIARVDFSVACRSLADEFDPLAATQSNLSFPSSLRSQKKPFEELMARYAVREDSHWPVARSYLTETRKIDPAIVDELHAVGSIYANDHRPDPSLVFLHRDAHGKVRGATLRDTRHQSAFRPCLGNKLSAWHLERAAARFSALSHRVLLLCQVARATGVGKDKSCGWVRKLFADGAYAGQLLAWVKALIPRRGLKIEIVKRINAGFKILPKRWVVERTFAWLARYRRLAKDYERKTKHSEATTYIASCKSCSPSL